jgi:hypothetical protein
MWIPELLLMQTKGLKHATSEIFFSKKNPICFFLLANNSYQIVVCEKEKIDTVSFEKMSLAWHVLDI